MSQPDIVIGGMKPAFDVLPGALVPPVGHAEDLPAVVLPLSEVVRAEDILTPAAPVTTPAVVLEADDLDALITAGEQAVVEWIEDVAETEKELERRKEELGRARGQVQTLSVLRQLQREGRPIVVGVASV